jgi:hypothetical protein
VIPITGIPLLSNAERAEIRIVVLHGHVTVTIEAIPTTNHVGVGALKHLEYVTRAGRRRLKIPRNLHGYVISSQRKRRRIGYATVRSAVSVVIAQRFSIPSVLAHTPRSIRCLVVRPLPRRYVEKHGCFAAGVTTVIIPVEYGGL